VKIDVEGHELLVLRGGAGLIQKNRPVILFEQHPRDFDQSGHSVVIEHLRSMSYSRFAVVTRSGLLPAASAGVLARICGLVKRMCFGYKMKLERIDVLKTGFYPIVVALP
jgi:hypothetical protein